ncbi:MAG: hypothetical protein J6K12_00610 [Clostridia bacterium]|nr:hypothetical protein [Clostridia bacterium]
MKRIFNIAIVLGMVLIICGAGGYESFSASFGESFMIMLLGAFLMGIGVLGKEKNKKICRRYALIRNKTRKIVSHSEKVCKELA